MYDRYASVVVLIVGPEYKNRTICLAQLDEEGEEDVGNGEGKRRRNVQAVHPLGIPTRTLDAWKRRRAYGGCKASCSCYRLGFPLHELFELTLEGAIYFNASPAATLKE